MKNFMKILSLWLSKADRRTDGRTDIMKLIDAFHNFTKTPKNESGRILTWTKIM